MDCEEFLDAISEFFKHFDADFMTGFVTIVNQFYKSLKDMGVVKTSYSSGRLIQKYCNEISCDQGIPIRESIEECLDFFEELNPVYYTMAISAFDQSYVVKGNPQDSSVYDLNVSNGKYDASTMCHEITHAFVIGKDQVYGTHYPESPIMTVISEINSYVSQFLYYHYLYEKKNKVLKPIDMLDAMISVVDLKNARRYLNTYRESFEILCNGLVWNYSGKILDFFNLDSYLYCIDIIDEYNSAVDFFSHPFGIMIASFIYLKILENPENIKMFLGIEKAQGIVGDEEMTLRSLEALGIPGIQDGKFSLNDDSISLLVESLSKMFEICRKNQIDHMPKLFSNGPLIKKEYFDDVNSLFGRVELEEQSQKQKKTT